MGGKVVFEGKTKSGIKFLLRYPRKEDLEKLLAYINTLSNEQTFIRLQGKQLTLEKEKEYLDKTLQGIKKRKIYQLLAFVDDNLIGVSDIRLKDLTESHVGVFGITVAYDFRSKGIGKILMEMVLEGAQKNLPDLKTVILTCFANNQIACELYKAFGFKEYGRLPKGLLRQGEFVDQICMYKKIL